MRNWTARRWKKRSTAAIDAPHIHHHHHHHREDTAMTDETKAPHDTTTTTAAASPLSRPKPGKPRKRRMYEPKRASLNIQLPNEFVALCAAQDVPVTAAQLVRSFIADLCGIAAWSRTSAYATLGEAAREAARAYHRVACQARRDKASKAAQPDQAL
jgi:hypothetical protein